MEEGTKSGVSALFEWLLGVALAMAIFHYMNISTKQSEELRNLVNISCFAIVTIGALFKEQKYKILKFLGARLISIAFVLLGVGAVLIVQVYKGK